MPAQRRLTAVFTALVLLVALLPGVAAGENGGPPEGCFAPLPASEVTKGMIAEGWTVRQGRDPEPFTVEVLGVLKDAILPGRDIIVVEVSGQAVDPVGGIWFGMSGSPVYVEHDGETKLLGAVAWGFTWGVSAIGGLTTGGDIVDLMQAGPEAIGAAAGRDTVMLDTETRDEVAARTGETPAKVGSMRQLPMPLSVSGMSGRALERFRSALAGTDLGVVPYAGSSASVGEPADASPLRPGDSFAGALSYGDLTLAGVGTTTYVCDGQAIAFGHPFLFTGDTRMGANAADAITVVVDPVFGPFKLATIEETLGVVDEDRFAGIHALLGDAPSTTPITSEVTALDTGRSREGRTDVVFDEWLNEFALFHTLNNFDSVFDQIGRGSSSVGYTVSGDRADGSPFEVRRDNVFASDWDIAWESVMDLFLGVTLVQYNPFEDARVTAIDVDVEVEKSVRSHDIVDVLVSTDGETYESLGEIWELFLDPEELLLVDVVLRSREGTTTVVELELEVPDTSGFGMLEITGGSPFEDPFECIFFPEECAGPDAGNFDGLLDMIASRPRNDDLVARLVIFPEGVEPPPFEEPYEPYNGVGPGDPGWFPEEAVIVEVIERVDQVVVGYESASATVGDPWNGPLPPGDTSLACPDGEIPSAGFVDTVGNVHAALIDCLAAWGIIEGVADGSFAPRRPVRRDQAASFLVRLLDSVGAELPDVAGGVFTDLVGNVHAGNIERLAAAGLIQGRTATTYAPQQRVTRGQMATMLVGVYEHATGMALIGDPGWFVDTVGHPHEGSIDALAEAGIMAGVAPGIFSPGGQIRRDQSATAMARTLNRILEDGVAVG